MDNHIISYIELQNEIIENVQPKILRYTISIEIICINICEAVLEYKRLFSK